MLSIFNSKINLTAISVFTVWLFVVSALIGIALGFEDWFIPKTPLNLLVGFGLLYLNLDFSTKKSKLAFFIAFAVGMLVEILGVATGKIFGVYHYGDNMGIKLMGVPYMIGLYWAVLVSATSMMTRKISSSPWIVSIFGASAMVILDIFMEVMAGRFDFWHFADQIVPLQNYVTWFLVSYALHVIAFYWIPDKGRIYSWHLYLSQMAFFVVTYLILS